MKKEGYLRNLVFGVEDGLVSTLGFVSGIAAVDTASTTLLLVAIVLIFSEAFSMAAGSFLTAESIGDLKGKHGRSMVSSIVGAVVMFVAYLAAGSLVIAPYVISLPSRAFPWSVALSLGALFLLGVFTARVARVSVLIRGVRAVIVGGAAIALGIFVAKSVMSAIS